jgi:serine/threonine protein kinase
VSLAAGTKLGPYEILSLLGAGGMGEVYRARDTRLDRTVAVKVLPQHLSSSPEVRQRFEREAKTISQLSHPHICALYDVGREGETEYLVMELLEGETLSERLAKGPLPLEQTLRYGVEIADALDKAHRQGIVHRDLKPGNVMITKSGVKLLDFGLAKAMTPATAQSSLTALPTQQGLTQEGTILGTFQYMAPEQLEGKEADARTDIFAFGAVLYEMATGRKAFSGATQASLITSIMSAQPPSISSVQPASPAALDRMVRTCVAKDPEDRWQSAADLRRELRWIGEGSQSADASRPPRRLRGREVVAWGLAAVAALLWVAGLIRGERRSESSAFPMRSSISLGDKSALRSISLSPDGRKLAFVARDASGKNLLWIRPLDAFDAQPLLDTENASFPFWSPDGRSLGFFADGKLKRIDTAGGPPQSLANAPVARGGSWSRDGVILFSPVVDGPLYRIPAAGGVATQITRLDPARGESSHRWPFFLPDGRHFLYLVANFGSGADRERMGIYVRSLDSKDETLLLRAKSSLAYVPSGYLLFLRERTLVAQPFDAKTLKTTGEAIPLAQDIQYFPQTSGALFSAAQDVVVYSPESSAVLSRLLWLDRSGRQVGSLGSEADLANPRISPDGKRVVLDITDHQSGNCDVWIYQSSGGIATRLTSDPALDAGPIWSPDGERIAFTSLRRIHPDIYERSASGSGIDEVLLASERTKYLNDWSPDGRFILYRAFDEKTNLELWTLPVGGEKKEPISFLKAAFGVSHGQFSPDGRWVVYQSNESGKWEIYVAPFPGPGGNWKISTTGGSEPRWRRDGKELYYLARDGKLMAAEVKPGATFEAGTAAALFQMRRREHISAADLFSYDVAADGQRFLVNTDIETPSPTQLAVFANWSAAVKRP